MLSLSHTHQSENLLIIEFEHACLSQLVRKKLSYYLRHEKNQENLLKNFYQPVEKSLIEIVLDLNHQNQIKTAKALGINRNTLRSKITSLKVKKNKIKNTLGFFGSKLMLTQIEHLDLSTVSRLQFQIQSKDPDDFNTNLKFIKKKIESCIIEIVLDHFKGNKVKAAKALGINRNTLKSRMIYFPEEFEK